MVRALLRQAARIGTMSALSYIPPFAENRRFRGEDGEVEFYPSDFSGVTVQSLDGCIESDCVRLDFTAELEHACDRSREGLRVAGRESARHSVHAQA